jgi:hypothetical protein
MGSEQEKECSDMENSRTLSKGSHDGAKVVLGLIGVMSTFQAIEVLVQEACHGRLAVDVDDCKCIARHDYSVRFGLEASIALRSRWKVARDELISSTFGRNQAVSQSRSSGSDRQTRDRSVASRRMEQQEIGDERSVEVVGRGVYATQFGAGMWEFVRPSRSGIRGGELGVGRARCRRRGKEEDGVIRWACHARKGMRK